MVPNDATDHLALLAIMMVRVLAKRLDEVGQLDDATRSHLRRLVESVRTHASSRGLFEEMDTLFSNLDKSLVP